MKHEGMKRLKIQLPQSLKAKLDALRAEGTTASGLIRRLLNEFFGLKQAKDSKESRSTKAKG